MYEFDLYMAIMGCYICIQSSFILLFQSNIHCYYTLYKRCILLVLYYLKYFKLPNTCKINSRKQ